MVVVAGEEEEPPLPRIWFIGLVRRSVSLLEPIPTRALQLPLSLRHSVFHPQKLSLLPLSLYTKAFFVFYHLLRLSNISIPFFISLLVSSIAIHGCQEIGKTFEALSISGISTG